MLAWSWLACAHPVRVTAATPPGPPPSGPGAPVCAHAAAVRTHPQRGIDGWWRYDPADPPATDAPVVVCLHPGYGHRRPVRYEPPAGHLARRGYTVLFPHRGQLVPPRGYAGTPPPPRRRPPPDTGRIALVGHSPRRPRRPPPRRQRPLPVRAIVLHDPAGTLGSSTGTCRPQASPPSPPTPPCWRSSCPRPRCSDNGGADGAVAGAAARRPPGPRRPLRRSRHAARSSRTTSASKAGSGLLHRPLDGIDWWGYWRPTEAVLADALRGEAPPDDALGRGAWSDGVPVTPLQPPAPCE
ncbi:MAG: hypothetical protein R3F59_34660 [Myxococcota bacterium]